jgi:PhoH-like ATPase
MERQKSASKGDNTARARTKAQPQREELETSAASPSLFAETGTSAKPTNGASSAKPRKPRGKKREVKPKLFVLDTNVLLHDPSAVRRFEENDLAIPITVLEEVDRFKKGPDLLNYHAREITRHLDDIARGGSLTGEKGAPIGDGLGSLRVIVGGENHPSLKNVFFGDSPDHRILSAACKVRDSHPDRDVVLVSKDVSLRLKARSLGLQAEDYQNDKAPEPDKLYKGRFELTDMDADLIDRFYAPPYMLPFEELGLGEDPTPNSYWVLKGGGKSALARYDARERALMRVEKRPAYGIMPRNSEQTFALDALLNPEIQLVTLAGKAGTGKTLIALAGALESRRKYEQIYLARPVVPLGRQELGYLPGDIKEKLDPYMQPLWDNLGVIRGQYKNSDPSYQKIQQMLETEKLRISALAYIRGRSLNRIFFIVDEAQNLTPHEVKTIITRAGEGTKIILTGDPYQIDSPYLDSRSNGLTRLIDRMRGQGIYAHVTLERGERSQLSDLASDLL